jgi:hypothetical protein
MVTPNGKVDCAQQIEDDRHWECGPMRSAAFPLDCFLVD